MTPDVSTPVLSVARRHWGLVSLLAVGVLLRVTLVVSYSPAILNYPDTWGYVRSAAGQLMLPDSVRPAGYSIFLRAVHDIWSDPLAVVLAQHVLGLATAVVLYALLREVGAPKVVALVPAAVSVLSIDLLYFEHTLLSETLFTFLVSAAMLAAARLGFAHSREAALLVGACAVLLAAAVMVRTAGVLVVPFVLVAVALGARGRLLARAGTAAAIGVLAVVPLGVYAAAHEAATGTFALAPGGGWAWYARAAPFADCREFEEPPGTSVLCEARPAAERPGGDFYAWGEGSPGRAAFVGPPFDDELVGAWGRAAVKATPRAYLRDVAQDLWRVVDADAFPRPWVSGRPETLDLTIRDKNAERLNASVINPYYGRVQIDVDAPVRVLADLQRVLRVHGWLVLLAVVTGLAGIVAATVSLRGAERRRSLATLVLLWGAGVGVPVVAIATTVYNWRYVVPTQAVLLGGAAYGLWLVRRTIRRSDASEGQATASRYPANAATVPNRPLAE